MLDPKEFSFNFLLAHVAYNAVSAFGNLPGNKAASKAFHREFLRCETTRKYYPANGGEIESIATSCGIFVNACLYWAGFDRSTQPYWGRNLIGPGGWVDISMKEPYFKKNLNILRKDQGVKSLQVGDVFYIGNLSGSNGHVGIICEDLGEVFLTAEGGGGAKGLTCGLRERTKDTNFGKGRPLTGVFNTRYLTQNKTRLRDWILDVDMIKEKYGK